jgi:hypothetical protein
MPLRTALKIWEFLPLLPAIAPSDSPMRSSTRFPYPVPSMLPGVSMPAVGMCLCAKFLSWEEEEDGSYAFELLVSMKITPERFQDQKN